MNRDIALIIKNKLAGANYVDKLAGLAIPYQFTVEIDDNQTSDKIIPIDIDVDPSTCESEDDKNWLVPEAKLKSLIFFEDLGVNPIDTMPDGTQIRNGVQGFQSLLKLIGWVNQNHFVIPAGSNISSLIILDIRKRLNAERNKNLGNYSRLQFNIVDEAIKNQNIFSNYTFRLFEGSLLVPPYDYFALTIQTTFAISESCISQIQTKIPNECEDIPQ